MPYNKRCDSSLAVYSSIQVAFFTTTASCSALARKPSHHGDLFVGNSKMDILSYLPVEVTDNKDAGTVVLGTSSPSHVWSFYARVYGAETGESSSNQIQKLCRCTPYHHRAMHRHSTANWGKCFNAYVFVGIKLISLCLYKWILIYTYVVYSIQKILQQKK